MLGPGHYWPYLLKPFYWMARQIPASRAGAKRLGLVTLTQMISALAAGVASPADGIRIVEVPEIASRRAVRLIGTSVSANRSFPQALTESRTDPRQRRSLNFPLLQVQGNMGESFQLTP